MVEDSSKQRRSRAQMVIPQRDEVGFDSWFDMSAEETSEDVSAPSVEKLSVRPGSFGEYIGQERILENLRIACDAAKYRGQALDHVLLHGPPGLGKTSLAKILAEELGVGFKSTSGPVIERPGDLAAILTSLEQNDILFIDEIHRMPRVVEEVLYPALEDFSIDILIGQGPAAKSVTIDLKPFTLVGATTRTGLLTSPLRDRFGIIHRLEYYSDSELQQIVERSSRIIGVEIERDAAREVGRRSRGTPRIANRLLRRVRDFAHADSEKCIRLALAQRGLNQLEIDELGLDKMDRLFLETLATKFGGGPVGIDTLAAAIGEERDTLEDVYEPFLLQSGFIARTRRGREITERGLSHIGLSPAQSSTQESFSFSKASG